MQDLALISPYLIVLIMGLAALLVSVFSPNDSAKGWVAYVITFGFVLAFGAVVWLWGQAPIHFTTHSFSHALILDRFGLGLIGIILLGASLVALTAVHYLPEQRSDHGEYYGLMAFSVLGMMVMVTSADLLTFFIALELMSISIYVLAGFKRHSSYSTESALKYFILGSFASAILLLGISFTYGATGSLSMVEIGEVFQTLKPDVIPMNIALLGMVLILTAFFFKIAAAPFHMWTPDVYEGAPSTTTAFMAIGVKIAAFGGFARLLLTSFGGPEFRSGAVPWETIIAVVAVISMFTGNLMALAQKNLKRMLAYSAIAHTGYILLALLVTPKSAESGHALNALGGGMIFYLLGYALASAAAFGVAAAVSGNDVEDIGESAYAGLAKRSPYHALVLAIAILSLLGIPLTAGFMGKLTIFQELLGSSQGGHLWLIVIAVVNSVISAWYYLRVILVAYMREADPERPIQLITSRPLAFSAAVAAILTLIIGVLPSGIISLSQEAGKSLSQTTQPALLEVQAASVDRPSLEVQVSSSSEAR